MQDWWLVYRERCCNLLVPCGLGSGLVGLDSRFEALCTFGNFFRLALKPSPIRSHVAGMVLYLISSVMEVCIIFYADKDDCEIAGQSHGNKLCLNHNSNHSLKWLTFTDVPKIMSVFNLNK